MAFVAFAITLQWHLLAFSGVCWRSVAFVGVCLLVRPLQGGVLYWLIDANWGPGPECVFKWKYPVYPGNRHQAAMSGQFIAIRVLNKRCDFCASAV